MRKRYKVPVILEGFIYTYATDKFEADENVSNLAKDQLADRMHITSYETSRYEWPEEVNA